MPFVSCITGGKAFIKVEKIMKGGIGDAVPA